MPRRVQVLTQVACQSSARSLEVLRLELLVAGDLSERCGHGGTSGWYQDGAVNCFVAAWFCLLAGHRSFGVVV